jgi:hypothetical protein
VNYWSHVRKISDSCTITSQRKLLDSFKIDRLKAYAVQISSTCSVLISFQTQERSICAVVISEYTERDVMRSLCTSFNRIAPNGVWLNSWSNGLSVNGFIAKGWNVLFIPDRWNMEVTGLMQTYLVPRELVISIRVRPFKRTSWTIVTFVMH